jgi:hypothetical protein
MRLRAIVACRLPESPIGWLFCPIGLSFGVGRFSAETKQIWTDSAMIW